MIYETKFYNRTSNVIRLYADCYGTESLVIPSGESKFTFERNQKNIWTQFSKVEFNPLFAEREEVLFNGGKIKTNMEDGFTTKTKTRKGWRTPFSRDDFVTIFENIGGLQREFFGIESGKIYMPKNIKVFVALPIFEHHIRYESITIGDPVEVRRPHPTRPNYFVMKKKANIIFKLRKDSELKKIADARKAMENNPPV